MNKAQIYSFTSNFPNLQGLKAIPVSLYLLMIVVWANQQQGESRDLTLPILISAAMAIFYWFVDQYYRLNYGSVRRSKKTKTAEYLLSAAASLLALTGLILDSTSLLRFSLLGLLWSVLLVFDGIRIRRSLPGKPFPFFWIFAVLMGIISLLPLFGWTEWWRSIGFQDQILAILAAASIISLFSGILWHSFLLQNLIIGDQS